MLRSFSTRLAWALGYLLVLLTIGSVGYVVIEGWPFRDALYMTAITLSAVGYDEVRPLSQAGRTFTIGLIFLGISALGIWIGLLTALIVESDLAQTLKQRKTVKGIAKLSGHVVVCGAGRTGTQVVEELQSQGRDYVVIEREPRLLEALMEEVPDCLTVEGDATLDHTLESASIASASGLVACLSSDTDNLYVALSARALNPSLTIVARAYDDESVDKLYRAGADHVVSPNVTGAMRMAAVLLRPSVVSFLDVATRSPEVELRLEEARVSSRSPVCGRTLGRAKIRESTGLMVIAVRKGGEAGEFVFNPSAETPLDEGDEMIVLGRPDQIQRLTEYIGV